jgi:hypothetical protein
MNDVPLIINHVAGCENMGKGHSDAAKRMADTITLHWVAIGWESARKWMAFRLADGRSDDMLYPSKVDAITHQKGNYYDCMYLCMSPGGMSACEAEVMLKLHRRARARNFPNVEVDSVSGGPDIIPRIGITERQNQTRRLGE